MPANTIPSGLCQRCRALMRREGLTAVPLRTKPAKKAAKKPAPAPEKVAPEKTPKKGLADRARSALKGSDED